MKRNDMIKKIAVNLGVEMEYAEAVLNALEMSGLKLVDTNEKELSLEELIKLGYCPCGEDREEFQKCCSMTGCPMYKEEACLK